MSFYSKPRLTRSAPTVRTRVTAVICSCGYSWSWWTLQTPLKASSSKIWSHLTWRRPEEWRAWPGTGEALHRTVVLFSIRWFVSTCCFCTWPAESWRGRCSNLRRPAASQVWFSESRKDLTFFYSLFGQNYRSLLWNRSGRTRVLLFIWHSAEHSGNIVPSAISTTK